MNEEPTRKPTCEGTNSHGTGCGTVSVRKCRKSAHKDFAPYCEIHGMRYMIFKLRNKLEQQKQNMLDAAHIMERDNMQASDAAHYIRKILGK
jgi:hypothetical protein